MSATTPSPLEGLSILIVDDHQDTVEMFVAYLGKLGADIIGSSAARAAVHIATTRALDAVLVDLRMRNQDGWWFLRELRALRNANAKVPVFAIRLPSMCPMLPARSMFRCPSVLRGGSHGRPLGRTAGKPPTAAPSGHCGRRATAP
jgi:Response regulator receiver domain